MSFSARKRINKGCYEHPHSGVGIEYSTLGGPMAEGQILIHEVGYLEQNARWMFPNTVSPFWRLYYNFDPGHQVLFPDRRIPLEPDRIVLIPDHQVFDSWGEKPVRHFWITFSLDLTLKRSEPVILPIHKEEKDAIRPICRRISSPREKGGTAGDPPGPGMRFAVLHESSALLHRLFVRPEIPWNDRPRSPEALKVAAHVARHFEEPLEAAQLARIAGMSARKLSEMFQREYHMTVPRFVSRVRVREAARLLESTDLSLEIIADRTGFGNRYYLTRVFTRITGKPPARFRKESRDGG